MIIDIGSIAYGPELEKKPIMRDLERLSRALRVGTDQPLIDLTFVVPGSLGGADFSGYQVSRRGGRTIVFIEVPHEVAGAPDPLPRLVSLARGGINLAASSMRPKSQLVLKQGEAEVLLAELERAAAQLGLSPSAGQSPALVAALAEPAAATLESTVIVTLPISNDSTFDEAFALEDALQERLEQEGVGYVDGNEVGDGEVRLFCVGTDADLVRAVVAATVRSRWRYPGVTVRVEADDDREISTTGA